MLFRSLEREKYIEREAYLVNEWPEETRQCRNQIDTCVREDRRGKAETGMREEGEDGRDQ